MDNKEIISILPSPFQVKKYDLNPDIQEHLQELKNRLG